MSASRARAARELGMGAIGIALLALAGLGAGRASRVAASPLPPSVAAAPALAPAPTEARCSPRALGADVPARVVRYELAADLDADAHTIDGHGTIRLRNPSEKPLDELWVHLYLNAFESDATVFGRKGGTGFRGAVGDRPGGIDVSRFRWVEEDRELWPAAPHTPSEPLDKTDIRVPLPRALAPGEEISIDVAWRARLPSVVLRTGWAGSFHFAGQWFPKLARIEPDGTQAHFPFSRFSEFYADFADYDVTVSVPDGFVVGATGRPGEAQSAAGRTTTRFVQGGVHDFAFTAWDGFEVVDDVADGVALRALVPRGEQALARRELEAARGGLAHFGARFGRYPYEGLTLVHPPSEAREAGGMEYPTLITTGDIGVPELLSGRALEGLVLHELAHQWFYGLVATNENRWPFLDEGLTTWAAGEALLALYPEIAPGAPIPVGLYGLERAAQLGAWDHGRVADDAAAFATGRDYGQLVYDRTATLLRTIDRVWDGGAGRAVARYACEGRFAHPTPSDLERALEQEAGPHARAFFHAGVFEQGFLDVEPLALTSEARDDGFEARVTVARRGTLVAPVEIELTDEAGERARLAWDGASPYAELSTKMQHPVVAVVVDPDAALLVDEDKRNDALSTQPRGLAPRSAALAALSFAALTGLATP